MLCYVFTINNFTSNKIWGIYSSPDLGWATINASDIEPERVTVDSYWLDDLVRLEEEEYSA